MADKIVMVDTSILIDYYRKTDKTNAVWVGLVEKNYSFVISSITKYEIYSGATESQIEFWNNVLRAIAVIPFDANCVDKAVEINTSLKKKRKQIDIADLFIAATAITNNLSIATLNLKHFERIDELKILK